MTIDDTLRRRIAALTAVLEQAPLASSEHLGVEVTSLNTSLRGVTRGHMHAKRRAAKARSTIGAVACVVTSAARHLAKHGGLVVHLVRYGAGELDGDNLEGAFKALRDGFARKLKVDDRDPRVQFVTSQHVGEHVGEHVGVLVELYRPLESLPLRRRA